LEAYARLRRSFHTLCTSLPAAAMQDTCLPQHATSGERERERETMGTRCWRSIRFCRSSDSYSPRRADSPNPSSRTVSACRHPIHTKTERQRDIYLYPSPERLSAGFIALVVESRRVHVLLCASQRRHLNVHKTQTQDTTTTLYHSDALIYIFLPHIRKYEYARRSCGTTYLRPRSK
jgi:hypothetical protein